MNDKEFLELINKRGICLIVPESECLNDERLTIHLYKKNTSKKQWDAIIKALGLDV